MPTNRTVVKTINQGESTEIQFGVGEDDNTIQGYILVHSDGTATFQHGAGVTFFMAGDDTRLVLGEDQYAGRDGNEQVIWSVDEVDKYQVIGLYQDSKQRYATTVEADNPEHAELVAQRTCAEDNGQDPEDDSQPLLIAAVIQNGGVVG